MTENTQPGETPDNASEDAPDMSALMEEVRALVTDLGEYKKANNKQMADFRRALKPAEPADDKPQSSPDAFDADAFRRRARLEAKLGDERVADLLERFQDRSDAQMADIMEAVLASQPATGGGDSADETPAQKRPRVNNTPGQSTTQKHPASMREYYRLGKEARAKLDADTTFDLSVLPN